LFVVVGSKNYGNLCLSLFLNYLPHCNTGYVALW